MARSLSETVSDINDAIREGNPMELTAIAYMLRMILAPQGRDGVPAETRTVLTALLDRVEACGQHGEADFLRKQLGGAPNV